MKQLKIFLNSIPTPILLVIAIFLSLAPFTPEPHLWQKIKMLFDASLTKPIDIFDLFLHGTPLVLLIMKLFISTEKEKVKP